MKVLLLGGSGFIGRALAEELHRQGHFIRIFALPHESHGLSCEEFIGGSFSTSTDFKSLVQDMDVVFHLISTTLPSEDLSIAAKEVADNVVPTIFLIQALKTCPNTRLVFLSSGGTVYGNARFLPISEEHPTEPICSYGIQKLAIEKYLELHHRQSGLDYLSLRLANPYGTKAQPGRRQGAIPIFFDRVLNAQPITIWGDGHNQRDYIHIRDAVEGILRAAFHKNPIQRIFNLGTGQGTTTMEILELIEGITGKKALKEYQPTRGIDVDQNVLDCARAAKFLNWSPKITLIDGIRLFYQSFLKAT